MFLKRKINDINSVTKKIKINKTISVNLNNKRECNDCISPNKKRKIYNTNLIKNIQNSNINYLNPYYLDIY